MVPLFIFAIGIFRDLPEQHCRDTTETLHLANRPMPMPDPYMDIFYHDFFCMFVFCNIDVCCLVGKSELKKKSHLGPIN
jgi:hypothetical protein